MRICRSNCKDVSKRSNYTDDGWVTSADIFYCKISDVISNTGVVTSYYRWENFLTMTSLSRDLWGSWLRWAETQWCRFKQWSGKWTKTSGTGNLWWTRWKWSEVRYFFPLWILWIMGSYHCLITGFPPAKLLHLAANWIDKHQKLINGTIQTGYTLFQKSYGVHQKGRVCTSL